jgi:hypothetical protein
MQVKVTRTNSDFVSIFPNPAADYLTVDLNKGGGATLELLTLHGQSIASYALTDSRSRISLTDLPSGIYAIRIEQEGDLFAATFVKR